MRILNTASVDRSKFQEYKSEAKPGWTSGKKNLILVLLRFRCTLTIVATYVLSAQIPTGEERTR